MAQCQATTAKGRQCRNLSLSESTFCRIHQEATGTVAPASLTGSGKELAAHGAPAALPVQPTLLEQLQQALDAIVSQEKRTVIGREAKWLVLFLGIVALLGQQAVLNLEGVKDLLLPVVENARTPGAAGIGDYLQIGQVAWASLPLTLSIAFIYWGFKEEVLQASMVSAAVVFAVLAGALLLGNSFGFQQVSVDWSSLSLRGIEGILWAIFVILSAYLTAYGIVLFISALAVGIFVGRALRVLTQETG